MGRPTAIIFINSRTWCMRSDFNLFDIGVGNSASISGLVMFDIGLYEV